MCSIVKAQSMTINPKCTDRKKGTHNINKSPFFKPPCRTTKLTWQKTQGYTYSSCPTANVWPGNRLKYPFGTFLLVDVTHPGWSMTHVFFFLSFFVNQQPCHRFSFIVLNLSITQQTQQACEKPTVAQNDVQSEQLVLSKMWFVCTQCHQDVIKISLSICPANGRHSKTCENHKHCKLVDMGC